MLVSNPNVFLCGLLGTKHHLTNLVKREEHIKVKQNHLITSTHLSRSIVTYYFMSEETLGVELMDFFFLGGGDIHTVIQLYCPIGIFSQWRFGLFSPRKDSSDTVALPNLLCMLDVLVFP